MIARAAADAALATLRGATVWFDMTACIKLRGRPAVGITRVEREYAAALLWRAPESVGFCRFEPTLRRFCVVGQDVVRAMLERDRGAAGARAPRRRGPMREAARALERRIRLLRRGTVRQASRALPLVARLYGEVRFRANDILVLGGESWESHDLAYLAELRRRGVLPVVLCYDIVPLRFPHFHLPESVAAFDRFAQFAAREAALILCISAATRDDLKAWAQARGATPGQMRIVPLGRSLAPAALTRPPTLPDHVQPGGFVLSVGTLQVRKNHELLYQVWRRLAEKRGGDVPSLVLAGAPGHLTGDLVHLMRHDPLVAPRIAVAAGLDDSGLGWLYEHCLFTLYPSLYEGWGLPISESLAHGKACIASSTSAMPEAGQGLAIHLDPLDFAAWRREIESLIDDPASREGLEARIKAEYRPLGWTEAADAFLGILADLAGSNGPQRSAPRKA